MGNRLHTQPAAEPKAAGPSSTVQVLSAVGLFNIQVDLFSSYTLVDCRARRQFEEDCIDLSVSLHGPIPGTPSLSLILYGSGTLSTTQIKDALQMVSHTSPGIMKSVTVIKMLEGGFDQYQSRFPYMCTRDPRHAPGRLYPSVIADNVYLSNFGVASNPDVLDILNVTHIVNCTVNCPYGVGVNTTADSGRMVSALRVPVVDDQDQNIQQYFTEAVQFIQNALDSNRKPPKSSLNVVLIHCKHGQSRSATIAAAWLLHCARACPHFSDCLVKSYEHIDTKADENCDSGAESNTAGSAPSADDRVMATPEEAVAYLKRCRPRVNPNKGFIKQLQSYHP